MAAVAGSKGRLSPRKEPTKSLQISLVKSLLAGTSSATEVAHQLLSVACVREIGLDTNMTCNLRCRYCYLEDRLEESGSVPINTLEEKLKFMLRNGTKLVAFIGKEPLADNRAISLLNRLNVYRQRESSFRTGMVTNGTLVPRWIDAIVESNLSYLDISIDGLTDDENILRGQGSAARAFNGVKSVVKSKISPRFATASVITKYNIDTYHRFVNKMTDEGVETCFASPVLNFAVSNDVDNFAVSLDDILFLCDRLQKNCRGLPSFVQIIIDLPYTYSWNLLMKGYFEVSKIQEDCHEALFYQIGGSNIYFKINPFPYSYWRALRITHDGKIIFNMDLAAHASYSDIAHPLNDLGLTFHNIKSNIAVVFLKQFIERHVNVSGYRNHDRDILGQFERSLACGAA